MDRCCGIGIQPAVIAQTNPISREVQVARLIDNDVLAVARAQRQPVVAAVPGAQRLQTCAQPQGHAFRVHLRNQRDVAAIVQSSPGRYHRASSQSLSADTPMPDQIPAAAARSNHSESVTPGRVILLNGSSSSGKTTLAHALQRVLPEPWQHVALDHFRDGMPGKVRGLNSPPGSPGASGLNIVPLERDGQRMTHVQFGDYGEAVLRGMRRSVAQLVVQGVDVIVDDLLFKPEYLHDYQEALHGHAVWFVGVRCSLPVVEQREARRPGRFPGTATSHFHSVHAHGIAYDVEVHTDSMTPAACAMCIRDRLALTPVALTGSA